MTTPSPEPTPDAIYEALYPSGPPADTLTPDERAVYDAVYPPATPRTTDEH